MALERFSSRLFFIEYYEFRSLPFIKWQYPAETHGFTHLFIFSFVAPQNLLPSYRAFKYIENTTDEHVQYAFASHINVLLFLTNHTAGSLLLVSYQRVHVMQMRTKLYLYARQSPIL